MSAAAFIADGLERVTPSWLIRLAKDTVSSPKGGDDAGWTYLVASISLTITNASISSNKQNKHTPD